MFHLLLVDTCNQCIASVRLLVVFHAFLLPVTAFPAFSQRPQEADYTAAGLGLPTLDALDPASGDDALLIERHGAEGHAAAACGSE